MKNLMDIIIGGEQVFETRLKFAFEPSSKQVERIKQLLEKYDVVSVDPMKRTMFQVRPLDFYNLDAGEIWMLDVQTARPIQHDVLLYELGSMMKVSEALIRVRDRNSLYQEYAARDEDGLELDEYITKLTDEHHEGDVVHPTDNLAGDKFVDKVVEEVKKDYSEGRTPYSEYMSAAFSQMYPKAKPDVEKDAGPTKE